MQLNKIKPNKEKALMLAKKILAELICDTVNLEDINYTVPEVQTLLDGITVGGHKITDQNITLNQKRAFDFLFNSVSIGSFSLSKEYACKLHKIAAFEESLTWGEFRDGGVSIAGTEFIPPEYNKLDESWKKMIANSENIADIYDRAIFIFLQMARNQFFYDVNKRMGRFIMNGILLSQGLPIITIPITKKLEFNKLMIEFYPSNDSSKMTEFMKSCVPEKIINAMN